DRYLLELSGDASMGVARHALAFGCLHCDVRGSRFEGRVRGGGARELLLTCLAFLVEAGAELVASPLRIEDRTRRIGDAAQHEQISALPGSPSRSKGRERARASAFDDQRNTRIPDELEAPSAAS